MKIIGSAIAASIVAIATVAQANPLLFCTERTGMHDSQCYPVYAGISYPTGTNTEFHNNASFSMNLNGWYVQGCSAAPVLSIQIASGQGAQHYAFDPYQNRKVLYTWCSYDATPGFRCNNNVAEPVCTGNN